VIVAVEVADPEVVRPGGDGDVACSREQPVTVAEEHRHAVRAMACCGDVRCPVIVDISHDHRSRIRPDRLIGADEAARPVAVHD
jgi:hypothetical protein